MQLDGACETAYTKDRQAKSGLSGSSSLCITSLISVFLHKGSLQLSELHQTARLEKSLSTRDAHPMHFWVLLASTQLFNPRTAFLVTETGTAAPLLACTRNHGSACILVMSYMTYIQLEHQSVQVRSLKVRGWSSRNVVCPGLWQRVIGLATQLCTGS